MRLISFSLFSLWLVSFALGASVVPIEFESRVPSTALDKRDTSRLNIGAQHMIDYMKGGHGLHQDGSPFFYTGKDPKKPQPPVMEIVYTFKNLKDGSMGFNGGYDLFDVVPGFSNVHDWNELDYVSVTRAFAQYVRPSNKRAFLVYSPIADPDTSEYWNSIEWPALLSNPNVEE
ncbi:hypothetical protein H0H92_014400, partial [Tricholoma furcatifolium]